MLAALGLAVLAGLRCGGDGTAADTAGTGSDIPFVGPEETRGQDLSVSGEARSELGAADSAGRDPGSGPDTMPAETAEEVGTGGPDGEDGGGPGLDIPADCTPTAEWCNGKDDDCDGLADEDFPDSDGDAAADCMDVDDDNDGWPDISDCAPLDPSAFPEALEQCNGFDDNCDGTADEGFVDHDGDKLADCADPDDDDDGAPDEADCKEWDPSVYPGAQEVCNGIDDNCDGVEDGPDSLGCKPYLLDKDQDGFGGPAAPTMCLCEPSGFYSSQYDLDCDDTDPTVNPLAAEKCNQLDDNCNDSIDEGVCFLNCQDDTDCLPGWKCNGETGVCYDLSCLSKFEPGDFNPAQEWQWKGSNVAPSHNQVMATPSVADLDGDGLPEIVFAAFAGSQYNNNGIVRAIHGDGSGEVFTLTGHPVYGGAMPALGDIDGDKLPEIVVTADLATGGMHAWDHDGKYLWTIGTGVGDPSIADLNGDGAPEIVLEYQVVSPQGKMLWNGAMEPVYMYNKVSVADLDGDGFQEVTLGGRAYSPFTPDCPDVPCGKLLWDSGAAGGFTAVADVAGEAGPEVIAVGDSTVAARDGLTGALLWQVPVPGTGGGAPNVADFDGDGGAEIGIAGLAAYTVFDGPDGKVLWSKTTQDYSSSSTGSSVFDFESDGEAEVVYNDELTLRIYKGKTGDVIYSTPNGSGTLFEYPVIVDVDADNNAEIVVASNDYAYGSFHGIRVLGDATDHWVSTRKIWNQHAYHITNVNEDGTIPLQEQPSWVAHNTYRCNLQMAFDPAASPDATIDAYPIDTLECPEIVVLTVLVRNTGTLPMPKGTEVGFFVGPPGQGGVLAGMVLTDKELPPGGETTLIFKLVVKDFIEKVTVYAVVDPNGKVSECIEGNNTVEIPQVSCE
jgi:hypothetical protein